jgi:short subunit dehydrogenase-like uncharacterized protein
MILDYNLTTFHVEDSSQESLSALCHKSTTIINCSEEYDEVLIQTCLKTKTDYIDITKNRSQALVLSRKYHHLAESLGIFVIPSCNFPNVSY